MATYDEAVTEKQRIMAISSWVGVSVRVTALSGAYGVSIHDARPSELKTVGQANVLGEGNQPRGKRIAWSAAFEPAVTQAIYT